MSFWLKFNKPSKYSEFFASSWRLQEKDSMSIVTVISSASLIVKLVILKLYNYNALLQAATVRAVLKLASGPTQITWHISLSILFLIVLQIDNFKNGSGNMYWPRYAPLYENTTS